MTIEQVLEREARIPPQFSAEEWELRCELAACYQLTDLYGLSDMAGTHISARLPGPEHHFLLNPYGMFFDEITASSLIKVDMQGRVIEGSDKQLNKAGFVVHSAVHMANSELVCVMHTHADAITAVGMQKDGLLPLSQKAATLMRFLSYHDYEGVAESLEERQRLVRDLGPDGRCMILRNHGGLTVGTSVAEALAWMIRLDKACRLQVQALAGGREPHWMTPEAVELTAEQGWRVLGRGGWAAVGSTWPALLRKLERERGTSYRT